MNLMNFIWIEYLIQVKILIVRNSKKLSSINMDGRLKNSTDIYLNVYFLNWNKKMVTIYGLISDNGDGSASMHWFRSKDKVDEMLDEENGHEQYWSANDCGPSQKLTFPDDLDLKKAGFRFKDD